jgi:hypothetical protein
MSARTVVRLVLLSDTLPVMITDRVSTVLCAFPTEPLSVLAPAMVLRCGTSADDPSCAEPDDDDDGAELQAARAPSSTAAAAMVSRRWKGPRPVRCWNGLIASSWSIAVAGREWDAAGASRVPGREAPFGKVEQ